MMDTLKPYPEYKDSGLTWLGCIPQHWEVRRNGRLFMQRNSTGYGRLPILEVSLRTGVRVRNMDNLKRKQVISDRNKYKRAAKGDIAYNMMRMWQGAVGVAPVDGLVSPAYVVVRPRPEVEPRYFSYLFRTDIYKKEVDGFSRGIVKDRNRLYWEDFKRIPSCFPSLAEQKIIADYLDANAVRVHRFIHNRRQLVEVLNEQKQAIINQAVTRGLKTDAPLKSSGMKWPGDVPVHWKMQRLKQLGQVRIGLTYAPNDVVSESGTLVLRASNILNGKIVSADDVFVSKHVPDSLRVVEGDILICVRSGSRSLVGKSAIITKAYAGVSYGAFMSLLRSPDNPFIYWVLNSRLLPTVMAQFETSTINQLTQSNLGNLSVPMPPAEERAEIVQHLTAATSYIDSSIHTANREINLIREYRTRLISDVVTGKIDVRHLAPPPGNEDLEETFEALEPLEDVIDDVEMDEEEEVNESD
jgi:type I restriction enzyme S subunit